MRRKNGKIIFMHHQVLGKSSEGLDVDHIDDNGLNNQRDNLRFVTRRENLQYMNKPGKTSIYPGVWWSKKSQKWTAELHSNGKKIYLGLFTDEKKAAEAYQQTLEKIENPSLPEWTMEELIAIIKKVKQTKKIREETAWQREGKRREENE